MNKSVIIHTSWLAVAAGAYVFGNMQSRPAAEASSIPKTGPAKTTVVNSSVGSPSASVAAAPAPGDWLKTYRGKDGTLSATSMAEAISAALKDSDPVKAMTAFTQLLAELTPENAPAMLKSIRESTGGFESMRYLSLLGYAWGEKDGKAAIAALGELGGRDAGWTKSTALAGWASQDPEGAMKYLAELKASREKEGTDPRNRWNQDDGMLERGLISGLARKDVNAALNYVMSLKEDQRGEYMGVLAEQQMKLGSAAASAWAMALTDEKMRASALDSISRQFVRQDDKAAAEWAASIAGQPGTKGAVGQVAESMARKSPSDATTWAMSLPAGEAQNEAFRQIFSDWTRSDPTAASTQLTQMQPGAARDAAINTFAKSLARENPKDALTWTGQISDAAERLKVQAEVARRWNYTAPAEAGPWIAANLPAELQAEALQPRQDRGFGGGGPGGGQGGPPAFGGQARSGRPRGR